MGSGQREEAAGLHTYSMAGAETHFRPATNFGASPGRDTHRKSQTCGGQVWILTLDRTFLTERVGRVSREQVELVLDAGDELLRNAARFNGPEGRARRGPVSVISGGGKGDRSAERPHVKSPLAGPWTKGPYPRVQRDRVSAFESGSQRAVSARRASCLLLTGMATGKPAPSGVGRNGGGRACPRLHCVVAL